MKRWILAAFTLLATACIPVKPPVVKPPVLPPVVEAKHVRVEVCVGSCLDDVKVPGATVKLDGIGTFTTDGAGNVDVIAPEGWTRTHAWITADRFKPYDHGIDIGVPLKAELQLAFTPLLKLAPWKQFFRVGGIELFTVIGVSKFNLLNRWQHGEDITPQLRQLREAGVNYIRVWTLYNLPPDPNKPGDKGIGVFIDIDYARVGAFLDLCAEHGLYVELTAYTSTERVEHWQKLQDAVRGRTNVLLELGNELDQPVNRLVHMLEYGPPLGILASHGSNGADQKGVEAFWDYSAYHSNGLSEEQRKVGHNAMELSSGPVITDETSRWPDVGMWSGQSLDRQKQLAYDAAKGAALLCAGAVFHSVNGKTAELYVGNELEVLKAWVDGARSVDLACQAGPYVHRQDLETTGIIRAYERLVAGHNCQVLIRN